MSLCVAQEMSRADKWLRMIKDPKKFFPPGAKNRQVHCSDLERKLPYCEVKWADFLYQIRF
jgi:hypothetical protein